ncbi:serine hydrolase domain-containing protein [Salinarimonas ramus]|uniref:6-aminohexanoate-dimer hydrolase n=1 Tax=Salinarimonas ramus TaxID=690164 RepID=A0A917V6H7_9HYPH|nr:serine hydrolase [Salinarimonas ramus]GGK43930.1 6-aminohexanoate-dimer hydrolase [Salinarimonas ramus]
MPIDRRALLALAAAAATLPPTLARAQEARPETLDALLDEARAFDALETVLVSRERRVLAERGYGGASPDRATNIKSASKTIVSALVGIAIERDILHGVDQPIAPLLRDKLPADPDPRLSQITIGHLLTMRAGLERTSGANYGSWVASRDWVHDALRRPFVDEPGGRMLYSTGSTHLLSAILARESGRPTRALADEWLGAIEGFRIADWERSPQGIHLGGNQMAMTPRSLLAFGETYAAGGRAADGTQVIPEAWVEESWRPRTRSRFTGDGYGYAWFARRLAGRDVRYAWGYGGQMLYVVPELDLVIAMTSDETRPSARTGYRDRLHALAGAIIDIVAAA